MSHIDTYNLSTNGEFRVRLAAAMTAYVPTVLAEAPTTPNHDARVTQAMKVLYAHEAWAAKFSLGAATALGGQMPTDAQLDALVLQYWDTLALAPQVL